MSDLFGQDGGVSGDEVSPNQPLADQLRPKKITDISGQEHLTGPRGSVTRMVQSGSLGSMIFWGPPGSGKTTLARLLAGETGLKFLQLSAIFSGVNDLKKAFETARMHRLSGHSTLLFVDEIHRFNRAQLDSFLPVMEDGTIVLVGATTENPSFELNAALLSRANVMIFNAHDDNSLEHLLQRAEAHMGKKIPLDAEARQSLIRMADGDGRAVLSLAQEVWRVAKSDEVMDAKLLSEVLQRRAPIYDKGQDGHYNLISALHKSVRGSDPDAALYYLTRMMEAGEDRRFLARRLVRMASEDIGMADPQALVVCIAAQQSYEFLGSPEGELGLAQACVYLATAPKSNAVYNAHKGAARSARENGSLLPPKHILNAPTKLMKENEYGAGYEYDHNAQDGFSGQNYFPDEMERQKFYQPVERGFEREIAKRLNYWEKLRQKRNEDK